MHIVMKTENLLDKPEDSDFSGTVTVDVPSFPERQRFAMEIGLEKYEQPLDKDSNQDRVSKSLKMTEIASNASELVLKRVVKCDLHGPDGEHLTTVEEFSCHPGAGLIVEALVGRFISNFAGKKSKPLPASK